MDKPEWDHDGTKRTEGEVLALLFGFVRCLKPFVCVETGTFAGHGAKAIAEALEQNGYGTLDTVEYDAELYVALREVDVPRVTFHEGDSFEYVRQFDSPIDFAFVDCGEWQHRADVARVVMDNLSDEGVMFVHDTIYYPSLKGVIEELIGPAALHIPTIHGVTMWRHGSSPD